MSTSNIETLRDQFELAYATEWHTNGGRNKSTVGELAEVIKTWRNGNTYDDDLPRLQFGWEGFQWHAAATARRVQLAAERKGRIYVAGPMTGYVDHNFPAFNAAAERLRSEGWHVENPADHGEVPGAEWADYMRADVAMLASCGAIYLLPGWSKSQGASIEAQLAHSLGMEFHFAEGAERLGPIATPQPAPSAEPQLLKFYGVSTDAELVVAQAKHIERLQAKLPPVPSLSPQRVREG